MPHHMHVVHICSSLLQMSNVAWSECLSVVLVKPIKMGGWLMWFKRTMYKMGSKLDKSICSCEEWQDDDAAFCQITFYTCSTKMQPWLNDAHSILYRQPTLIIIIMIIIIWPNT